MGVKLCYKRVIIGIFVGEVEWSCDSVGDMINCGGVGWLGEVRRGVGLMFWGRVLLGGAGWISVFVVWIVLGRFLWFGSREFEG